MENTNTRWRIAVESPAVLQTTTEDAPELAAREALVETRIVGVCGSDTHAFHGKHPQIKLPFYPGHEVVGVVQAIGSDVNGVQVGDRVTPEPTLPCGKCKVCKAGDSNVCENLQFFGCGYREGGLSENFSIPADRLRHIPEDFTDEQALLIEPLATPVHAVRLAGDLTGKAVFIHGAGTIGLFVITAAKHAGAKRIVVSDPLESKRELALQAGADAVVDARDTAFVEASLELLGEHADVVFDCVSIQPTVAASIKLVRRGGAVLIVGIPAGAIDIDLPTIQDQQIQLHGAATYLTEDYATAIDIIRSGAVDPATMISSRFAHQQAQEAFELASTGTEVKVVITAY